METGGTSVWDEPELSETAREHRWEEENKRMEGVEEAREEGKERVEE